ncbi:hypothetical protein V5799_002948, partial [Amblyomma americanum]
MDAEQLELNCTDIWHKTAVEKCEERSPDMEHLTFAEFMTDYSLSRGTTKENDFLDGNGFDQIFDENKERITEAKAKYNSGVTKAELLQYICDINTRQDIVPLTDATTDAIQEDDDQRRTGCATLVEENDNTDIVPESTVTSVVVAASCPAVKKREDCMPLEVFYARLKMTNHRQRMLIEEVIQRVTNAHSKPLQIFTGPAGCGKTFTLRLLMDVYNRYCKCRKIGYGDGEVSGVNAYIACATTGKAAVALNGVTVHSAFKIVMTSGRDEKGLSASDLNTFRILFRGVRCIIIDEVSMLSSDLLRQVDRRLREIRPDRMTDPFGGFDVILCGDMRQLPPVRTSEVYKRPKSSGAVYNTGVLPWHHLQYFPLTQVVRQSDAVFSTLLTKVGDGEVLDDIDVALLESGFMDRDEIAAQCYDTVRLYYSNSEFDSYNEKVAQACRNTEHVARDAVIGYRTPDKRLLDIRALQTFSRVETGNSPSVVVLCEQKPY